MTYTQVCECVNGWQYVCVLAAHIGTLQSSAFHTLLARISWLHHQSRPVLQPSHKWNRLSRVMFSDIVYLAVCAITVDTVVSGQWSVLLDAQCI